MPQNDGGGSIYKMRGGSVAVLLLLPPVQRLFLARSTVTSLSPLLISVLDKAPLYALRHTPCSSLRPSVRRRLVRSRAPRGPCERATKDDRQTAAALAPNAWYVARLAELDGGTDPRAGSEIGRMYVWHGTRP